MPQPINRPQQQRQEIKPPTPYVAIGYKGRGKLKAYRGGVPVRSQAEILQLAGRKV